MIRLFAFLLIASPALAWGPYTHAALSEALLDRVASGKGHRLAFLVQEPHRSLFIRSALSPDMTLSATAGRKVDPAYNKLFHDRALGKKMIQSAWDAQDWKAAAFGLGWLGHAAADRSMAKAGSIIYKDLFGLPRATRRQLSTGLTAINKVTLDACALHDYAAPECEPHVDEPALIAAVRGPIAARKLALEPPEAAIPAFRRSFAWACSSLQSFAARLAANKKAYPDLIAELTTVEEGERVIPGFEDAVDAMERELSDAIAGRPSPPPEIVAETQTGDDAAPAPGLTARAMRKAKALAARGGEFLWSGTTITRKLREAVVDRSIQLLNWMGGDRSQGGRLLMTFAGDMLNDTKTWPEVRAHVAGIVAKAQTVQASR